jgi:hypothetical protein
LKFDYDKKWKFKLLSALDLFPFYFFLQKAAIKKIDTQSSKEFLAELKVLAEVHHLNFGMTFSQH